MEEIFGNVEIVKTKTEGYTKINGYFMKLKDKIKKKI